MATPLNLDQGRPSRVVNAKHTLRKGINVVLTEDLGTPVLIQGVVDYNAEVLRGY